MHSQLQHHIFCYIVHEYYNFPIYLRNLRKFNLRRTNQNVLIELFNTMFICTYFPFNKKEKKSILLVSLVWTEIKSMKKLGNETFTLFFPQKKKKTAKRKTTIFLIKLNTKDMHAHYVSINTDTFVHSP